jgi:hypothetical protein
MTNEFNQKQSIKHIFMFAPNVDAFRGRYEGETESKIKALFDTITSYLNHYQRNVTENNPKEPMALLCLDEGESLLGKRTDRDASTGRSVGPFLQMMDGVQSDRRIVTVVITNYAEMLDQAIYRRLTLRIHIGLPDKDSIILQIIHQVLVQHFMEGLHIQFISPNAQIDQMYSIFKRFGHPTLFLTEDHMKLEILPLLRTDHPKQHLGYSPSDLIQGFKFACNLCSRRCLQNTSKFLTVLRGMTDPTKDEYDYSDLKGPQGKFIQNVDALWIYDAQGKSQYTLDSIKRKDLIVSFDFQLKDIKQAFDVRYFRNSSTYEDYQRIDDWEKGNKK